MYEAGACLIFGHAVKVRHAEPDRSNIVGFGWHDLRHTFASRLVMAGVDVRTVHELMATRRPRSRSATRTPRPPTSSTPCSASRGRLTLRIVPPLLPRSPSPRRW